MMEEVPVESNEELADYYCTCGKYDKMWNHEHDCALWDSVAFDQGLACWSPEQEALRWLTKEELDTEHFNDEPRSLHDAVDDVIGGRISDDHGDLGPIVPLDEAKGWRVSNEDDGYKMHVVGNFIDDPIMKKVIDEVVTQWLDKGGDEPPNFSYRGVTWVWDKTRSTWGAKRLGCYCDTLENDKDAIECLNCEVGRLTPAAHDWWQLGLKQGELTCYCPTAGRWRCEKCRVRRMYEWEPWEEIKTTYGSNTTGGATSYTGSGSNWSTFVPKCRHYGETVEFPDGTKVWASSAHTRAAGEELPDFGFYLDKVWTPECLAFYIPWQDFGLPTLDWSRVVEGIKWVHKLAQTATVEIGCIGGHGRTGTVLACLAVLSGVPVAEAVDWVQTNYCEEAVEGMKQEWWVEWFDAFVNDKPIPEQPTFSAYGHKRKDRSKYKGQVAYIYCDQKGQYYCGQCTTDCKEMKPEEPPKVCWWCEVTFKFKEPEPPKEKKGDALDDLRGAGFETVKKIVQSALQEAKVETKEDYL